MQRKKVQIQSSDPSALASDQFNLDNGECKGAIPGCQGVVAVPDHSRGFALVSIKPDCIEATSLEIRYYGSNKQLPVANAKLAYRLCCDHYHPHYSCVT